MRRNSNDQLCGHWELVNQFVDEFFRCPERNAFSNFKGTCYWVYCRAEIVLCSEVLGELELIIRDDLLQFAMVERFRNV